MSAIKQSSRGASNYRIKVRLRQLGPYKTGVQIIYPYSLRTDTQLRFTFLCHFKELSVTWLWFWVDDYVKNVVYSNRKLNVHEYKTFLNSSKAFWFVMRLWNCKLLCDITNVVHFVLLVSNTHFHCSLQNTSTSEALVWPTIFEQRQMWCGVLNIK